MYQLPRKPTPIVYRTLGRLITRLGIKSGVRPAGIVLYRFEDEKALEIFKGAGWSQDRQMEFLQRAYDYLVTNLKLSVIWIPIRGADYLNWLYRHRYPNDAKRRGRFLRSRSMKAKKLNWPCLRAPFSPAKFPIMKEPFYVLLYDPHTGLLEYFRAEACSSAEATHLAEKQAQVGVRAIDVLNKAQLWMLLEAM